MWLITTFGFFSVVRKPGDDELTVRARSRRDLDRLRETYLAELGPIEANVGTDYKFRARTPVGALASAAARMVSEIDYSNFKNEVATRQGATRAHLYSDVWSVLTDIEDDA